jgi:hypothetical protein
MVVIVVVIVVVVVVVVVVVIMISIYLAIVDPSVYLIHKVLSFSLLVVVSSRSQK